MPNKWESDPLVEEPTTNRWESDPLVEGVAPVPARVPVRGDMENLSPTEMGRWASVAMDLAIQASVPLENVSRLTQRDIDDLSATGKQWREEGPSELEWSSFFKGAIVNSPSLIEMVGGGIGISGIPGGQEATEELFGLGGRTPPTDPEAKRELLRLSGRDSEFAAWRVSGKLVSWLGGLLGKAVPKKWKADVAKNLAGAPFDWSAETANMWMTQLGYQAPIMLAVWGSTVLGGPAGGYGVMTFMETGVFHESAKITGLDDDIAKKYAKYYGPISGAIEYAQNLWMLKSFGGRATAPLTGKAKAFVLKVIKDLPGIAWEGVEELSQNTIENYLMRLAIEEQNARYPGADQLVAPTLGEGGLHAFVTGAVTAGFYRGAGNISSYAKARMSATPKPEVAATKSAAASKAEPTTKPAAMPFSELEGTDLVTQAPGLTAEEAAAQEFTRLGKTISDLSQAPAEGAATVDEIANEMARVQKQTGPEADKRLAELENDYELARNQRMADQYEKEYEQRWGAATKQPIRELAVGTVFKWQPDGPEYAVTKVDAKKDSVEYTDTSGRKTQISGESQALAPAPATGQVAAKAEQPPVKPPSRVVAVEAMPDPKKADASVVQNLLDKWVADRDETAVEAQIDQTNLQNDIKKRVGTKTYGKKAQQLDQAVQVYIDIKGNEGQIAKYWGDLSAEQQAIVTRAMNLTPAEQALAENMIDINRAAGEAGFEAGVLNNVLDNYTMRLWEQPSGKRGRGVTSRFAPTTPRAKQRTLESILHGWSLGMNLQIKGASNAQQVARTQVAQAVADRNLLKLAQKAGVISPSQISTEDGQPYVAVEHPNFSQWVHMGEVTEGEVHGAGVFVTEEGQMFKRSRMYAHPAMAKQLNQFLGQSSLKGIPFVDWVTKWNAKIKRWILTSSFFHHQAFLRSFTLASKAIDPVKGYAQGGEAIRNFTPELRELVRGGLTIGHIADWDELAAHEATLIGKVIDRVPGPREAKAALAGLAQKNTDFLFKKLGPQFKVQAALLEYRYLLTKRAADIEAGTVTKEDLAKLAASITNDDFGGLHHARLGYRGKAGEVAARNPTVQHILQVFTLAPDWTESNIRTALKAFRGGQQGKTYRAFWGRVLLKGLGMTVLFNYVMSLLDDEDFVERFQGAWEEGKLRWLDVDITPIYRALGGDDEKRKYFSLLGHLRDPVKFLLHPFRSAKGKSSVVGRMAIEAAMGTDWAGRPFTTWKDALAKGQLVEGYGRAAPLEPEQIPSYLLHEARSSMPIQVQNAMSWLAGEIDAFDAITRGAGLTTSTTYEKKKKPKPARGQGIQTEQSR